MALLDLESAIRVSLSSAFTSIHSTNLPRRGADRSHVYLTSLQLCHRWQGRTGSRLHPIVKKRNFQYADPYGNPDVDTPSHVETFCQDGRLANHGLNL